MGRPRYRLLPHTADVRLLVWGSTVEELVTNAVHGALRIAVGRRSAGAGWSRIELRGLSQDPARLLVSVVNEALFLLYGRCQLVRAVELHDGCATLRVVSLPAGSAPETEVKAATFHGLAPERGATGRLRAVLTLDL
jgi:SHS2 domain-containing protein